jgi:glucose/mannose-6-phosphate isomerase
MKSDQRRILNIYHNWPQHFKIASEMSCELDHQSKYYKSLILCGMGGSATACDILDCLVCRMGSIPSLVVRGHHIPSYVDEHCLVLVNSVSGNTTETISMAKDAIKKNAEVICITSGGRLKDLCIEHKCKYLEIPQLSMPRAALPYLLIPGLRLISSFLEEPIEESIVSLPERLAGIRSRISIEEAEKEINIGRKIAKFFMDGFAYCYASPALLSVGTRFKNSLNENAKVHCVKESIMEASHNEIVPFTFIENCVAPKVLHVRWQYDEAPVQERFDSVRSLFCKVVQPLMELNIMDVSLINAMISSIFILDYATIYMALLRNLDPSPTPAIDILKGNSTTRIPIRTDERLLSIDV